MKSRFFAAKPAVAEQGPIGWHCIRCNRVNRKFAKFCGGCGLPVEKSIKEFSLKEKLSSLIPVGLQAYQNRLISFYSRFPKKAAVSLLAALTVGGYFWGIRELSATQNQSGNVRWGQVRSYVSRTFRLTNSELDLLLGKILQETPEISTGINLNHVIQLETAIKARLRDSRVSLFPNPFFSQPDQILSIPGRTPANFVFIDIPMDHPTYKALKALTDLGIFCGDKNLKFRPYDKICWTDWMEVCEKFYSLLSLNPAHFNQVSVSRKGYMSNYELNNFFDMLRATFGLPKKETFAWSSEPFFPSRLEAFSAFSSLVKELE